MNKGGKADLGLKIQEGSATSWGDRVTKFICWRQGHKCVKKEQKKYFFALAFYFFRITRKKHILFKTPDVLGTVGNDDVLLDVQLQIGRTKNAFSLRSNNVIRTKNISVVGGLVYLSPLLEKESKGAEIAKGKGRARARERGQAETGGTKELQFFQLTSPPQHCRLLPLGLRQWRRTQKQCSRLPSSLDLLLDQISRRGEEKHGGGGGARPLGEAATSRERGEREAGA